MTDKRNELPFQPIRSLLYPSRGLMEGFVLEDGQSLARTPDFRSFVYFVVNGRAAPTDPYAGMMEALHDNSILRAMYAYLKAIGRPAAAIMGGHREELNRNRPTQCIDGFAGARIPVDQAESLTLTGVAP